MKFLLFLFLSLVPILSFAINGCIANQSDGSTASNKLLVENLLGTYRRLPFQNNYHVGSISISNNSSDKLVWKNLANVSWSLSADLANNQLITDITNPYQNTEIGKNFKLQFQLGELIGFNFNNELYTKEDVFADSFDNSTGQLSIKKVTVGTSNYCNVVVTINKVISVGTSPANGTNDTFDSSTGLLTMPIVNVDGEKYYNVVVSIKQVLSAGILPDFNPTKSLFGYASVDIQESPPDYHYGFSLYTNVQKISDYHIQNLQFGWGTWLMPDNRATTFSLCPVGTVMQKTYPDRYWDVFQTIEGGLGQWRGSYLPYSISKFRLVSTPDCYNNGLSTPGFDFNVDSSTRSKLLGIAQLSNRLLLAPDGQSFDLYDKNSALFGYGYIALPLIPSNGLNGSETVGDQNWTLFINSQNFQGPVSFYIPKTFTQINSLDSRLAGKGLDAMPAITPSLALEINGVPSYTSSDISGKIYRRIARMNFPTTDSSTKSVLTQDFKHYSKDAFWKSFVEQSKAIQVPDKFNTNGAYNLKLTGVGLNAKMNDTNEPVVINNWVNTTISQNTSNGSVFSLSWKDSKSAGFIPEYFRKDGSTWIPISVTDVPESTNLSIQKFPSLTPRYLNTSDIGSTSVWSSRNWAAGPFTTNLNDGSTVTYVWYKFINQPAIAQLNLDTRTLQNLQNLVEKMHMKYGLNGPTFESPTSGNLVSIDNGLIVTPPPNLSVGYVPIAIGQQ